MKQIDVLKQALEALYDIEATGVPVGHIDLVIDTLRTAIEDAEKQEPVIGTKTWYEDGKVIKQNLYPSDVYKQEKQEPVAWVGLTDEERMDILLNLNWDKKLSHMDTALAIEAKLKEKNHG